MNGGYLDFALAVLKDHNQQDGDGRDRACGHRQRYPITFTGRDGMHKLRALIHVPIVHPLPKEYTGLPWCVPEGAGS